VGAVAPPRDAEGRWAPWRRRAGSKDNLIALASDQAWNEIALPDLTATDWRTAATQMATNLHAMLTRHPWLVQVFGSQLIFSLGKTRHDEHSHGPNRVVQHIPALCELRTHLAGRLPSLYSRLRSRAS
jgi:hypothetical protein